MEGRSAASEVAAELFDGLLTLFGVLEQLDDLIFGELTGFHRCGLAFQPRAGGEPECLALTVQFSGSRPVESFFATLKRELMDGRVFSTRQEAEQEIFSFTAIRG
ncbi:hypothetical protein D3875_10605 [Deinococcus cavernae]|uniref:Integrase catalytic domain-containing protein n=1 Tax=Deinococcus cavernae TaxID=2320857 RepID=A0A418V753_9DEIO|nr:hypothetical protein D3875_10605 [Deinococcus cavernae]